MTRCQCRRFISDRPFATLFSSSLRHEDSRNVLLAVLPSRMLKLAVILGIQIHGALGACMDNRPTCMSFFTSRHRRSVVISISDDVPSADRSPPGGGLSDRPLGRRPRRDISWGKGRRHGDWVVAELTTELRNQMLCTSCARGSRRVRHGGRRDSTEKLNYIINRGVHYIQVVPIRPGWAHYIKANCPIVHTVNPQSVQQ